MYGLDCFSGIGGITKALEGYVQPVAYCEIDAFCRGVLLSRMSEGKLPVAPIWDDVTTLCGHMLPDIDIIYGGFPCQDLSVAGRGGGLAGKRSGLFFQIMRLAEEIRPQFIFLENVPNIRTKGLSRVIRELARLRYDCRWGLISAADVGANHKRERWFLLAHATGREWVPGTQKPRELPAVPEGPQCTHDNTDRPSKDVAYTEGAQNRRVLPAGFQPNAGTGGEHFPNTHSKSESGLSSREREEQLSLGTSSEQTSGNGWWKIEPDVGRVAHGVPKRVDRLKGLGNAVVPAQAREAFERLMGLK